MWVTIIPFFLVANVIVDDSHHRPEWTMYGPEYTYDVLLNMSMIVTTNKTERVCRMVASELKCRPKGQDTLNCYFQNARLDHRKQNSENECEYEDTSIPETSLFVGGERFEIRFNDRGIENFIVPRTIPMPKLNIIKAVASQLDIGFDVKESRKNFKITENWKDSICQYNVNITRGMLESEEDDDDDDSTGGERFELALASLNNARPESLRDMYRVEKMRQVTNCPQLYFFGNDLSYNNSNPEVQVDTSRATSTSHITISKNDFVSSTTVRDVVWTSKQRTLRLTESISMKLKRIDFARTSLPEIKDPASTSKIVSSRVEAT